MSDPQASSITALLRDWREGNQLALETLAPLVYAELRRLAHRHLHRERPDHTLGTTALVHETYLRLVDQEQVNWQHRAHFFAICATLMRRILVDYARRRSASKRQLNIQNLAPSSQEDAPITRLDDLIALDRALDRLTAADARKGRVVELRFFGGLTAAEAGEVLGLSDATIEREWTIARAWLYREMIGSSGPASGSN